MNIAYIDKRLKRKILFSAPELITFETGHRLIMLPETLSRKKISKILKKFNAEMFDNTAPTYLTNQVNLKIIRTVKKENPESNVILCFENALQNLSLLEILYENNVDFTLYDGPGSPEVADFFLETRGIPVKITKNLSVGWTVYFGGILPSNGLCCEIINLSSDLIAGARFIKNFEIKGRSVPFNITTIPLLALALKLTGADFSDVIIKFGINADVQE